MTYEWESDKELMKMPKRKLIERLELQSERWRKYWENYYESRIKIRMDVKKERDKRKNVKVFIGRIYGLSSGEYKRLTRECKICGFNLFVLLHHIDKNRNNNAWNNFIGLCPNCHSLIHRKGWTLEELKDKYKDRGEV